MSSRVFSPEYGRELFREFTPSVARHVADALDLELTSTSLLADLAAHVRAPFIEMSYAGALLTDAVMRALRHVDAPLIVALSPVEPGGARLRREARVVLECAVRARFDRPLSLVVRASPSEGDDDAIDRAAERVMSALDVGITGVSFRPGDVADDAAMRVTQAARPFLEWGVGVELELSGTPEEPIVMAELDEMGVPIAAVRGASVDDELSGGLAIVDPLVDEVPREGEAYRLVIDGFLLRAVRDVLGADEGFRLFARAAEDTAAALREEAPLFDELPSRASERLEALAYAHVSRAATRLGARGTAERLLEALAVAAFSDDGYGSSP